MAILMPCKCGEVYNLKNEFGGKLLHCPKCNVDSHAPLLDTGDGSDTLGAFASDKYLIRQNHFAISAKYSIRNAAGHEVLYAERHSRYLTRMSVFLLFLVSVMTLPMILPGSLALLWFPIVLLTFLFINVRRPIAIYNNNRKEKVLLWITQNNWFQKKWIRYTLLDHTGAVLGYFEKNRFTDILRRRWRFRSPSGPLLVTAREDSLIASLLRRVTGYFFDFAIFRTNFVFYAGDSEQVIGEFNKKISLLDRYVLDMTMDNENLLDHRVALAFGVLLDTGEGR